VAVLLDLVEAVVGDPAGDAQVDAAIGGKTGANFGPVKNLVGSFHHPVAVLIDPGLLGTLPTKHVMNGMAEVIKIGVLADGELFSTCVDGFEAIENRKSWNVTSDMIRCCVRRKLELLGSDPFETGSLARLLNFGHCIGHPVEAASNYQLLHGEAVAIGMAVSCRVARSAGICDRTTAEDIIGLLDKLGLPTSIPVGLLDEVWRGVGKIERIRNGRLNLVVPHAIGRCGVLERVSRADLEAAA
jgi:3-dehydroquinate synthase